MKRLVLDTNVVVSGIAGIHRAESAPGELLRRWSRQGFVWCVSQVIFTEVQRTLETPYFVSRIPLEERLAAAKTLRTRTEWIELTATVTGVASHAEDDKILATAISAHADALVTGDAQLLALTQIGQTPIMTVRDALVALEVDE